MRRKHRQRHRTKIRFRLTDNTFAGPLLHGSTATMVRVLLLTTRAPADASNLDASAPPVTFAGIGPVHSGGLVQSRGSFLHGPLLAGHQAPPCESCPRSELERRAASQEHRLVEIG